MKNANKLSWVIALAAVIVFAQAANAQSGTPGLRYTVINNGTAYSVGVGTVREGGVVIPSSYRPNADSRSLPVTAIVDNASMIKIKLFLQDFFFFQEISCTGASWPRAFLRPSHNGIPPS